MINAGMTVTRLNSFVAYMNKAMKTLKFTLVAM